MTRKSVFIAEADTKVYAGLAALRAGFGGSRSACINSSRTRRTQDALTRFGFVVGDLIALAVILLVLVPVEMVFIK